MIRNNILFFLIYMFLIIGCDTTPKKEYIIKPYYIIPIKQERPKSEIEEKLDTSYSLCHSKNIEKLGKIIIEYKKIIKQYNEIILFYENQIDLLNNKNKEMEEELQKGRNNNEKRK